MYSGCPCNIATDDLEEAIFMNKKSEEEVGKSETRSKEMKQIRGNSIEGTVNQCCGCSVIEGRTVELQ